MQRLSSALDPQSSKEPPKMHFNGVLTDVEFSSNISVAQPSIKHEDELLLAFRQFCVASWARKRLFIALLINVQ